MFIRAVLQFKLKQVEGKVWTPTKDKWYSSCDYFAEWNYRRGAFTFFWAFGAEIKR